jgi:hypothetical protein
MVGETPLIGTIVDLEFDSKFILWYAKGYTYSPPDIGPEPGDGFDLSMAGWESNLPIADEEVRKSATINGIIYSSR